MLSEQQIEQAYEEIAGKLTNYLIANGMEYTAACDVVQESFIRLWKKREEMDEHDSISGFVFAVAKNLRTDWYRRNKFMIYEEDISEESGGLTREMVPDDDRAYLQKRIQQAMDQLSEEQRTAYTLFQIGGRSIKEIAAMTGASESNVKVRIHRAKEKLCALLQDLQ